MNQTAKNRAKRRRDLARARDRFAALILVLGGRCARCGTEEQLSVDHVNRAGWEHRKLRYDARVGRYWREFNAGIPLRCLCKSCNSASWKRDREPGEDDDLAGDPDYVCAEAPF